MVILFSVFRRTTRLCLQQGLHYFKFSLILHKGFSFFTPSATLFFLKESHPGLGMMQSLTVVLICISLMITVLNIFSCAYQTFVYLVKCLPTKGEKLNNEGGKSTSLLNSLEVNSAGGEDTATLTACLCFSVTRSSKYQL